jgi:hypothetical protein
MDPFAGALFDGNATPLLLHELFCVLAKRWREFGGPKPRLAHITYYFISPRARWGLARVLLGRFQINDVIDSLLDLRIRAITGERGRVPSLLWLRGPRIVGAEGSARTSEMGSEPTLLFSRS